MSALQQVQIHDFNDSTVVTTLFQLTQWKHALQAEIKGFAVVSDKSTGLLIKSANKLKQGQLINIRFSRDSVSAEIKAGRQQVDCSPMQPKESNK